MKLSLLTAALILSTGAFAQDALRSPTVGGKPLLRVRPTKTSVGCTLVGTVKGTKLWVGDCVVSEQLRSSIPAETSEPSLPERAGATIPPGQK